MAAIVPSSVDPNIRLAARPIIRIEMVPSRATENRHPNELVAPKIVLADRDDPLANWRVDNEVGLGAEDVRRAVGEQGVRSLQARENPSFVTVLKHGVALLDVVRLVEHELVRAAELPEPQEAANRRDDQGGHPAPEHVGGAVPEQPVAQLLGRGHGRHRMQRGRGSSHPLPSTRIRWARQG